MRHEAWHENQQSGWEQARMISFYVLKGANYKVNKFQDVIVLPWEPEPGAAFPPADPEEMQKFSDEADKVYKMMNPAGYEAYMKAKQQKQALQQP